MKLSTQERLIIELLCAISNKEPSGYDTSFIGKAVSTHQEWAIPIRYQSLDDGAPRPLFVTEVFAILETYRWISDTIKSIGVEANDLKSSVTGQALAPLAFDGFDGNNENDHLSTALMLVDDLDRYEEQKGKVNDTHSRRRDAYIKVANAYIKALNASGNYLLPRTFENLVAVLSDGSRLQFDSVELSSLWPRS